MKGKFSTAFRKFRKSVEFSVHGTTMPVYYYSPSRIKKIFRKSFAFLRQHPVGLFIPPSYLEKKFASRHRLLARLNQLEKKADHSFFSFFADHYCINFKKPA